MMDDGGPPPGAHGERASVLKKGSTRGKRLRHVRDPPSLVRGLPQDPEAVRSLAVSLSSSVFCLLAGNREEEKVI